MLLYMYLYVYIVCLCVCVHILCGNVMLHFSGTLFAILYEKTGFESDYAAVVYFHCWLLTFLDRIN